MNQTLVLLMMAFSLVQTAFAQTSEINETFNGLKRVHIRGAYCDVEVKGASGASVQLDAKLQSVGIKSSDHALKYERKGDFLEVWVDKESSGWNIISSNNGYIRLKIPANTEVDIDNSSGNVTVQNYQANILEVGTSSGNINLTDVKARLKVDATSGDITLKNAEGPLRVEATSGNIEIESLRGDITGGATSGDISIKKAKGDITLETTSGNIKLEQLSGKIDMESTSGDMRGRQITLTSDSRFESTSGSIDMDLINNPEELDFSLSSSSGRLEAGQSSGQRSLKLSRNGKLLVQGRSSSGDQRYY